MKKLLLEQIVNMNAVKYERLEQIHQRALPALYSAHCNDNEVDVFIDLYSIFKNLVNTEQYEINDARDLVSAIMNLVIHYRAYYKKKGVFARVYLIYSENTCDMNKKFVKGYNKKKEMAFNINPRYQKILEGFNNLMNTLTKFIEGVYYIPTYYEVGVCILSIKRRKQMQGIKGMNIIISKDVYLYQLTCIDTMLIRPKKNEGVDLSYPITYNNAVNIYVRERKVKNSDNIFADYLYMPFILAMGRLGERDEISLFSLPKVLSMVNVLPLTYRNDLYSIYNLLHDNFEWFSKKIDSAVFVGRIKSCDLEYQEMVANQDNIFISSLDMNLIDLHDPDSVKKINEMYFKDNPIDLERL